MEQLPAVPWRTRDVARCLGRLALAVTVGLTGDHAIGQSLDERLDEAAFLRGLVDRELPEVLEHYLETHPGVDGASTAVHRVALERLRLRDPALTTADREAALERMLAARVELIAAHPADPRRATWLADQGESLFFDLLPLQGSGLATLYGLPTDGQRQRAERVAREMNERMAEAEIEIERAIRDLETRTGYRDDTALQGERRRLSAEERERRIPFLRGVGAALHAELVAGTDARRQEQRRLAVRVLTTVAPRLSPVLAARARVWAALSLAGLERHEEAGRLLREVIDDDAADFSDVFCARLLRVHLRLAQDGPRGALVALEEMAARYRAPDVAFFRLLIADQRFLLLRERASARAGPARRQALREAFDAYLDLIDGMRELPRTTRRAIVYGKLARAAEGLREDELPAIVAIARADLAARAPGGAPEAARRLEAVLARSDLSGTERQEALFALAGALLAQDRRREAAARYLELAREHPTGVYAERAIELAASLANQVHRADPRDAAVRELLRETLTLLLSRYPNLPTIDRWRYVAGVVAFRDTDLPLAADRFQAVTPGSIEYLDARFMHVRVVQAQVPVIDDPRERVAAAAMLLVAADAATREIERAVVDADTRRRADLRYYLARLRLARADAEMARGEPAAALAAIGDIERVPGLEAAVLAEALRRRIDAYTALDRAGDARREIESFLTTLPGQAGPVLDSMLRTTLRRVEAELDEGNAEEARRLAEAEAAPLAVMIERWVDTDGDAADDARLLLARAASAHRLAGRYDDGLRLYDRLAADQPDSVDVLFGRADCLYGIGGESRYAEAIVLFKRVASAGPRVGHGFYWQSQLRILQILDRVGRSTSKIVPRIQRLRLEDPELGHERFRKEFQRLERKYARAYSFSILSSSRRIAASS